VTWYVATSNAAFSAATQYYQPLSGWSATFETNQNKAGTEFAAGMTGTFGGSPGGLPGFQCGVQTAPGSTYTDTCSLMQGTFPEASCTISGTATSCTSTMPVTMVAGRNYTIGFEETTSGTAPGTLYSSIAFASP
jgi:hypothetical protein